jgi:hypothetical protein
LRGITRRGDRSFADDGAALVRRRQLPDGVAIHGLVKGFAHRALRLCGVDRTADRATDKPGGDADIAVFLERLIIGEREAGLHAFQHRLTDRPLIFSAPMVRALLRAVERPGTGKTQTRRVSGLNDVDARPHEWSLHNFGPLGYMAKPAVKGRFGATFVSRTSEQHVLTVCPQVLP